MHSQKLRLTQLNQTHNYNHNNHNKLKHNKYNDTHFRNSCDDINKNSHNIIKIKINDSYVKINNKRLSQSQSLSQYTSKKANRNKLDN